MRRKLPALFAIFGVLLAITWNRVEAQQAPVGSSARTPRVFLDCNAPNCDFDHFRRAVPWIDWVRDREDADVHLLISAERTGGGGWSYTLGYVARETRVEKTLSYVSDPDDTDSEVRDGLTQTITLGLVQFVETSPVAVNLRVVYDRSDLAAAPAQETDDPWNLWVFRIGLSGSLDGESQQRGYNLRGNFNADRVAEDFKFNFRASGRYNRDEFDLEDGDVFINISEDYSSNLLMVWSLNDHWSAGATASANRSTFRNRDLAVEVGPALEYNIFPYAESTRRQLTFRYSVELAGFDYDLETVTSKTSEILWRHTLEVEAEVLQPWGEVDGRVEAVQYLHDPGVHRLSTFAGVEYRLFRGFSLDVFGSFARIKDQFSLPKEDLTEEEILLRRRQRETDFSFDLSIGFSYRLGSKFANIVNPRM